MERQIVKIDASNTAYSVGQLLDIRSKQVMTVAELIAELELYDDDAPVVLVFDGGYTYGCISAFDIEDDVINEEEQ